MQKSIPNELEILVCNKQQGHFHHLGRIILMKGKPIRKEDGGRSLVLLGLTYTAATIISSCSHCPLLLWLPAEYHQEPLGRVWDWQADLPEGSRSRWAFESPLAGQHLTPAIEAWVEEVSGKPTQAQG